MIKDIQMNEAMLLNIRSKMVTEILLDNLSEWQILCDYINVPMYKVFDLIEKEPINDKQQMLSTLTRK